MGFLSNLAKQIVDVDDDEKAAEIIRRRSASMPAPANPELPPPGPITPIVEGPPLPSVGLPPPTRMPVSINEPPPPRDPAGILAEMESVSRDASNTMAQADYSNATVGPGGELTNLRFPVRAPALPPPTRSVATAEGVPPPVGGPVGTIPERVMIGERYNRQSPLDRSAARMRALQAAAPESKVRDTGEAFEIEPPKRMGRLEAMGQGFREFLPLGAANGLGGMGGSGLVGAITGLIAPGRVQKIARKRETNEARQEYGSNLGLEEAALQNETRRTANLTSLARLQDADQDRALALEREINTEYKQGLDAIGEMQKRQQMLDPQSEQYRAAEAAIQQEADRLAKRTGRKVTVVPGNPRLNQLPRFEIDGQVIQQQHDGNWKAVFGSPKSNLTDDNADAKAEYEWQTKNAENEAKRNAALAESAALRSEAENRQGKVTQIAGQISILDAQMAKMSARDPALGPLKRQREQLKQQQATEEREMGEAYRKAETAKAEAGKYPSLLPPPKRARRGGASAPGASTGQSLSKAAWEASHPDGDWNAAVQEANRRGIPIIP